MNFRDPADQLFIVGRIDRDDTRVILFRLPNQPDQFMLVLDYVPQDDGKGSAYAQEMWLWCIDRGMEMQRDLQAMYDFMAYVDNDLAMEFRIRWM